MLGWCVNDTAREAKVSVAMVIIAEGKLPNKKVEGAELGIQAAFEAAGVNFIADGAGVTLRVM